MLICNDKPDLIFLTETIPKAQRFPIHPALLLIPGYTLFTNFDPSSTNLGACGKRGICIFVANHLHAIEVGLTSYPLVENLWLKISNKDNGILLMGCVYRSPSVDTRESVNELRRMFEEANNILHTHLIVTGDFNIPHIDWELCSSTAPEGHPSHLFIEAIQDCYLYQHVHKPTRFRLGESASILDLIFTNEEGMVKNLDYLPGLGSSDHVVLKFDLVSFSTMKPANKEIRTITDYENLAIHLSGVDWNEMHNMSLENCYQYFKLHLANSIEVCSVKKTPRPMKNLYMTREAWKLKRKKNESWSIFSHSHDPLDYIRFSHHRSKLRKLTRKLRRDFEQKLANDMKSNCKAFWRYANSRLHTRSQVGDLATDEGGVASCNSKKANILSKCFSSNFTTEGSGPLPEFPIFNGPPVCDIEIHPSVVQQKLESLRPFSSPGPDQIHPRVLGCCSRILALPLSILFRKSLDCGKVPPDWLLGEVTPIYKKGSRQDPASYRPISLTSVPSKVLESLVRDKILEHMTESGLMHPAQHGFLPKRSCTTQLLEVMEEWSSAADDRVPVDIAFLDFRKAFDTVPHKRLLQKLEAYGIKGKLLSWIKAFLTERRQRVIVQGSKSEWVSVDSGIPQGSVLGPTLFLIYVNDVPEQMQSAVKMFADDVKMFCRVSRPSCLLSFQNDLLALEEWSRKWLLHLNVSKCKVMHLGPANFHSPYFLNGMELAEVSQERDLGIVVDRDLKFHQQTAAVISKGSQMLAVVKRTFAHISTSTLPLIYKALVRPHLEYCNVVWGPFGKIDQQRLERVQRRATKLVKELRSKPYEERLRILNLPTLYYRRRRGDMITVYQLLHDGMSADSEELLQISTNRTTRRHEWKLRKPRARTAARKHSFSNRVVNDWNALPADIVSAATVSKFKAKLDSHWSDYMYTIP